MPSGYTPVGRFDLAPYFTAWVNEDGWVSFFNDVYGYDKAQLGS